MQTYELGSEIGRGASSVVYLVKERPDLVAVAVGEVEAECGHSIDLRERYAEEKALKNAYRALPSHVNVAPIVDLYIHRDQIYRIMQRAPGTEIHPKAESLEEWKEKIVALSKAPEEQYRKLTEDIDTLAKHNLMVDTGNPGNIFYHPDSGFWLIDLKLGAQKESVAEVMLDPFENLGKHAKQGIAEVLDAVQVVIGNLAASDDSLSTLGPVLQRVPLLQMIF